MLGNISLTIKGVGIGDLAVAYASQTEIQCTLTPPYSYVQDDSVKVHSMRRTKNNPRVHLLRIEYYSDITEPGTDCRAHHVWRTAKIRYNENQRTGKEYFTRSRKKKQVA